MPSIISWKEPKTEKGPWTGKIQKAQRNEQADVLHKKHVIAKKKQEAEAKATRTEELNNFENMLLDYLQPKDGKIKSNK